MSLVPNRVNDRVRHTDQYEPMFIRQAVHRRYSGYAFSSSLSKAGFLRTQRRPLSRLWLGITRLALRNESLELEAQWQSDFQRARPPLHNVPKEPQIMENTAPATPL
ncbi:hypothetical protein JR316_0001406 [Psilocybe cubensis]|uniref:Uncharacterized protein n=1 Tax=Psilocybe cubensis TaxID=181762 RepID=A0ACB8HHM0_PSICU|nr:hypothetical protein JR316_0001406 [Psilocybe cubensis]KAH9487333.1 hypothetical protein JR316_0001406 [Psilocybe cubensis]